jgi:hypothetical protein
LQRFCAFDVEEEARYRLDQHTSVLKYSEEFNKSMVELPTMDEKDRVHRFVEGLKPEVRKWIRLQKPTTLAAAIAMATHADHTVWAGRFNPPPYAHLDTGLRSCWAADPDGAGCCPLQASPALWLLQAWQA